MEEINNEIGLAQMLRGSSGGAGSEIAVDSEKRKVSEYE